MRAYMYGVLLGCLLVIASVPVTVLIVSVVHP
jgi:hypothetical protein